MKYQDHSESLRRVVLASSDRGPAPTFKPLERPTLNHSKAKPLPFSHEVKELTEIPLVSEIEIAEFCKSMSRINNSTS